MSSHLDPSAPPGRLDHITLSASEFAAAVRFYDAALAPLGLVRVLELGDEEEEAPELEAVAWGTGERPVIWLVAAPASTRAAHIALRAPSRAAVEQFHAAALAAGGRSHDAPRRWPIFRIGEFNAIVADPDGNLIEAVADE